MSARHVTGGRLGAALARTNPITSLSSAAGPPARARFSANS
jgi:hypothetical protein